MDYKAIREEYETVKTSFVKLADKYKTHYKALERRAKKEGWIKFNPKQEIKNIIPLSQPLPQITEDSIKVSKDIKELLKKYHNPIDNVMIMTYIDSYLSFRELQEEIKKEGKFIISSKGTSYMNPKYSALQMEKMNLIKIGKELGITLASRLKLQLDIEEENEESSIFDIINSIVDI